MISVEEASGLIKKYLEWGVPGTTTSICADRDYPPFHRVMMDGIAIRFADFKSGERSFKVVGLAPAGEPQQTLKDSHSCLEVMTGAPLPEGSDLVIPYEHLQIENGFALIVKETERVSMENIHLVGSDCKKGDVVLETHSFLNGPHRGIAASMGVEPKIKTPKIMVISTGDELVEVDQIPLPHQIRRSNVHALSESLKLNGFTDVTSMHLPDDAIAVAEHYQKYASDFDILIYSGGVSKGKFDYLPNVWIEMGVTRHFHTVSQRPGKPLWFGTDEKRKTTVIGLPGNPVSSLVCLHRYILPQREMYARLNDEIVFKNDLTFFVPVKFEFNKDGSLWAKPLKIKNSGEFTALAGSDGFIELPKEQSVFKSGESFKVYPWRSF